MTDGRQADALVNELKVARLDGHVDGCMFRWKVGRADGLAGLFHGRSDGLTGGQLDARATPDKSCG